jgi:hypothetical protein
MQPRRAGNIWSNEDANLTAAPGSKGAQRQPTKKQRAGESAPGEHAAGNGLPAAKKQGSGKRKRQEEAPAGGTAVLQVSCLAAS